MAFIKPFYLPFFKNHLFDLVNKFGSNFIREFIFRVNATFKLFLGRTTSGRSGENFKYNNNFVYKSRICKQSISLTGSVRVHYL